MQRGVYYSLHWVVVAILRLTAKPIVAKPNVDCTYLQCSKIATDSYELATQLKLGKSLKKDHTTILICAFNVCFVLTCFYFSFNAEAPLNPSAMTVNCVKDSF